MLFINICAVAKEASDIVILDDNFSSIVKSVMWGRAVFDNIRKFLQFQLTVNVVALSVTFLSAITGKDPPLNAVMMLWVNLIMDTMGALALGTEPPSVTLLSRRPYKRNTSLISSKMLRNILFQFMFQMVLLGYLLLYAAPHFGVEEDSKEHLTVVFNTFVFCQVFNEMNARSIGDDMNIFYGLEKNPLFLMIIALTVLGQAFIVQFGGDFVKTTPLSAETWVKCVLLGSLSLPLGGIMRLFPAVESDKNFATISPFLSKHIENAAERKKKASSSSSGPGVSLSFFIWIAVVGVLPLVTYQHFEEHWREPLLQAQEVVANIVLSSLRK